MQLAHKKCTFRRCCRANRWSLRLHRIRCGVARSGGYRIRPERRGERCRRESRRGRRTSSGCVARGLIDRHALVRGRNCPHGRHRRSRRCHRGRACLLRRRRCVRHAHVAGAVGAGAHRGRCSHSLFLACHSRLGCRGPGRHPTTGFLDGSRSDRRRRCLATGHATALQCSSRGRCSVRNCFGHRRRRP